MNCVSRLYMGGMDMDFFIIKLRVSAKFTQFIMMGAYVGSKLVITSIIDGIAI